MFEFKRVMPRVLFGVFVVAASAASLPASAQEVSGGPPREYTAFLKMKAADVMHMMDKQGRGKVSKEEFLKFHQDMFNTMDRNRDGWLTPEEFYRSDSPS